MKKLTIATGLLALGLILELSGPATAASVNLITNGGFDGGSMLGWWALGDYNQNSTEGGNPGGTFILRDHGYLESDPFIQQVVQVGWEEKAYTLSGQYALFDGYYGSRVVDTFAVDINHGSGWTTYKLDTPAFGTWGSFSYSFVSDWENVVVQFRAEIDGDTTAFKIDNISLVEGYPVPEPGALLLLGSGLAGLGGLGWRRRKTA